MNLCCHYCGFGEKPPEICPDCRSEAIAFSGFGTEKIERILNEQFPGAVIVRMDTDTVKKRTAISQILTAFSRKQIDILIGTQIVSKGLHFPNVTLVGVLNADIPLNFPDFRSSERTFNLITQVSGRAGRSEKGGEVIIQTYNPVHYAIQTAKNQNYEEFFTREIKFRQVLLYPPFCRIIRLVFRGPNPERLIENGKKAVDLIQERTSDFLSILGPVLCPISRIKNNYRAHIIIKLEETAQMRSLLGEVRDALGRASDQYIEIDIDPVSML
jgi:primosomal protein N' (replication factor Y)